MSMRYNCHIFLTKSAIWLSEVCVWITTIILWIARKNSSLGERANRFAAHHLVMAKKEVEREKDQIRRSDV